MTAFLFLLIVAAVAVLYVMYKNPEFKSRLAVAVAAITAAAAMFWEQLSVLWN